MADILVLITIILVIFYAKKIKKIIFSKFIMIFFKCESLRQLSCRLYKWPTGYVLCSAAFRQRMHKNVTDWMREEVFLQM